MSQSDFHKHHRKLRSQGGSGAWGNMIELPVAIHQMVHENPEVAYQHGLLVKSHDDPNQIRPDVRGFLASLGVESEPATKPRRARLVTDEELAERKSVSFKLPKGVDGRYWQELYDDAVRIELEQPDTQFDPSLGSISKGKLMVAIFERFTGRS